MNKVMLIGRLTADPRMGTTNSGMKAASFTLAVDKYRRKDDDNSTATADFFNCSAYDKQADFAQNYLTKGRQIAIVGRLQQNSYLNKNGDTVNSVKIVVEEFTFTGSKAENAETQPANSNSYSQRNFNNQYNGAGESSNYATANAGTNNSSMNGFMDLPDDMSDGIPF